MEERDFNAEQYGNRHVFDKRERYPSVYHFVPPVGWINDPNGAVFYRGEYHLFYQYNPYDSVWGKPFWGHAVTKDFIRYRNLSVALVPGDDPEYGCFSGGAIVANDRLNLFYTRHFEGKNGYKEEQYAAYSQDGVHFRTPDVPVIGKDALTQNDCANDFRDPNPVFLDGNYYLCVGNKDVGGRGQVLVFRSRDLTTFEYHMAIRHESFGQMVECPDLFRLNGRDVLVFSSVGYDGSDSPNGKRHGSFALAGKIDFENKTYSFDEFIKLDEGTDFYAPQTVETPDGRRIMFAWLDTWNEGNFLHTSGNRTSGRYALPRELCFEKEKLAVRPVREIYGYFGKELSLTDSAVWNKNFYFNVSMRENTRLSFSGPDGEITVGMKNGNLTVFSDQKHHLRWEKTLALHKKEAALEIFSDAGSLELFTEDGRSVSMQALFEGEAITVRKSDGVQVITAREIK